MSTPWSITTTVRSPERLRGLLQVLQNLEGEAWDNNTQTRYQIMLIQHRLYGYGSAQFYQNLPKKAVELIKDTTRAISYEEAEAIFNAKNYEDPAMRGRQSFNPLQKFGLASALDGLHITALGQLLLQETYDYEDILLKGLMKWQLPSPLNRGSKTAQADGIKPFIGTLHLIHAVNKKQAARGGKAAGLSRKEFALFAPTLLHHQHIEHTAEQIIALRVAMERIKTHQKRAQHWATYERKAAAKFLQTTDATRINKHLSNLKDYGDNAIRYFRLTRFLYLRGNGFYVDLEPRRAVEIAALLAHDNAQPRNFDSKDAYLSYLADATQPQLPWETKQAYRKIVQHLAKTVQQAEVRLGKTPTAAPVLGEMPKEELKKLAAELRLHLRRLQEEEAARNAQSEKAIAACVHTLENIFQQQDRPILLEKLSAFGLQALNDARKIQPNYPVGDDNEPTFTAPANRADIECFYKDFNAICEVTLLTSREQWYNEGQPVMRHLRDFEDAHSALPAYCLFVAPKLHRDTVNTFWMAVKYEYESKQQRIIPISLRQFTHLLKTLLALKAQNRTLRQADIRRLYDAVVASSQHHNNSEHWVRGIESIVSQWSKALLAQEAEAAQ